MESLGSFRSLWAVESDRGHSHCTNEDAWLVTHPDWRVRRRFARCPRAEPASVLVSVADGIGGLTDGAEASTRALRCIHSAVERMCGRSDRPIVAEHVLLAAFHRAHNELRDAGSRGDCGFAWGTTVTSLWLRGDAGFVAHVGDTRLFLLRTRSLRPITADHSYAAWLRRRGQEVPADRKIEYEALLTRSVGSPEQLIPDFYRLAMQDGDRLALCSDGVSKVLSEKELCSILTDEADPGAAATQLISRARLRSVFDDATAVVVHWIRPERGVRKKR